MFGHIKIECIGEYKHESRYSRKILRNLGLTIPNARRWVAEIDDFDEKFKYKRIFLQPKYNYSESNSTGSRGVFASYFPEYGKIYEVSAPVSWKATLRYFCEFDEDGEHELTEDEVVECLIKRNLD